MKDVDDKILNIDELESFISKDLFKLMNVLHSLSSNSEKLCINFIDEIKEKYKPNFKLNLNGLSTNLNAYIYYERYLHIINQLVNENKSKDFIDYYIFNNGLKELIGNGTSYYFNFRADKSKATLFRITENLENDNKNVELLKKRIVSNVELIEQSLINDYQLPQDMAKYMARNIVYNNERDIVKMWILLCVAQVNGNKGKKLQSYSKSLGVVLFKYAHGKCQLIIRENEDINCIKYNNEEITSFQLFDNKNKSWNNVEGFCMDFSNVRDDKLDNLNKWLNSLYDEEYNILSYSSPILDRHVVDTFNINSNTSKIVNIENDTELILFYRAFILMYQHNTLDMVIEKVFMDCINWLENMKNNQDFKNNPNIVKNIEYMIKSIKEIEADDNKNAMILKKIQMVLNSVNWKDEYYYFSQFIKNKSKDTEMFNFLNNTEDNFIMKLLKALFYYLDKYENKDREKDEE